jgi:hypothetical protein
VSVLLFVGLTAVYLVNRRDPIGSIDTFPAELYPIAMIRGDGMNLDRFAPVLAPKKGPMHAYVAWSRGHLVSRYPIGTALLFVALEVPQVWLLDRFAPGWERRAPLALTAWERLSKVTSAFVAALAGAALYRLLVRLGLGRSALPAVLAAALGSDLWVVASQAPWQHGPAALALTLTLLTLTPPGGTMTRGRLALGGLWTALMVAFRPLDVLLAGFVFFWVAWNHTRRLACFLPGPVVIGALVVGYNVWHFDTIAGGQAGLEALHPDMHKTEGVWSGDLLAGAAGTLASPSRGLFLFCPWTALALLVLPWSRSRLRRGSPLPWMAAALLPYFLMLSKYSIWWAGKTFGPRYWIDVVPVFAVLLAAGLEHARERSRALLLAFGAAIVFSVVVQTVGAFCYPSSWNFEPSDVDTHHERLWDWTDCELIRCLIEGRKPW